MPVSGLIALPPELLIKICSYLCWHCQGGQNSIMPLQPSVPLGANDVHSESSIWTPKEQMALLSLSRACSALRTVAQSFLYHYLYTCKKSDLYLFIRTLSNRPDLGRSVFVVDVAHASTRKQTPEDSGELRKITEHGVLVSLLLQLTPNLAYARVCLSNYASASSATLAQSDMSLPSLKRLALDSFDDGFLLDKAAPIIRLAPNLEVLHCHHCAEVTSYFLRRKTLDDSSALQNLTELSLTKSNLTSASLRSLLIVVGPRLAKFTIQPRTRRIHTYVEDIIKFDEVLALLLPWSQTLRELSFCLYGIQRPRFLRGVRVLREFRALQILRTQAAFFDFYTRRDALTSTLPPSVRELRLLGYSNLTPALQAFLEDFLAGKFPALSRIEIDDQGFEEFKPESIAAQELRQVATAFRSEGVDYIVHDQLVGD